MPYLLYLLYLAARIFYYIKKKYSGALLFPGRKLQNYRTRSFLDMGFCVHFVPRFDTSDSLPEPELPQIFAIRA